MLFFLGIFIPIELGLRAWYPYERTEKELFELGGMIQKANHVNIGLFGNSTIQMLGQKKIQAILSENHSGITVENYSVSGLSALNVLKAMQELSSLPDTCVILMSFRDADYSESKLENSILAIRAGARIYNWDAFSYHANHILEKTASRFIFSLGNFPPQRFLGQSARELKSGDLIMAYKSFFGYHVSSAPQTVSIDEQDKTDPLEYGRNTIKARLKRLQVLGDSYLNEYLKVCEEIKNQTTVILIRLPIDPALARLEENLFKEEFRELKNYCLINQIPLYDFNKNHYPAFETVDGIHMTQEAKNAFIPLMVKTLF